MDYGSNSFKSKEEAEKKEQEIKVEKIVTGPVKLKNNGSKSLVSRFLYGDAQSIAKLFTEEVLFPILKNTLYEILTKGLNVSLWGKAGGTDNKGSSIPSEKIAYSSIWSKTPEKKPETVQAGSAFTYDDIVFNSRGEAESVLIRMNEIIQEYGRVRVADMYEMAGVSGKWTYNNYGWKDVSGTGIVRDKDGGYLLQLPKASPL